MSDTPTSLLKQAATELGFERVGVCAAIEPSGFHRFLDWIRLGYAGEMQYLVDRQEAYRHPSSVLDGVKSLVMLAMNYYVPPNGNQVGEGERGTGKVARYACGEVDYHDLIRGRLKQLKKKACELFPGSRIRGVVDTAPLLEREFAQLAGLGWVGKNTLLLNRDLGSYFFLAALLVDCELEIDPPFERNHCGVCTACLDACPTKAFPQPYVLDARRCISYLTIEHRGEISPELRGTWDDWLFGCDVCQEVCPWNRRAETTSENAFHPVASQNPIDLLPLFEMTDDDFRARFRQTPLWRSKRRGLLRNAALVLGSQKYAAALPALRKGCHDSESLVRQACAWAIGRIAGEEDFPSVCQAETPS